jgi:stearoyl-CoA desaturase (delta-9 desaturase)
LSLKSKLFGKPLNWEAVLFVIGYHLALLVALPFFFIYGTFSWPIMITTLVLWIVTGLSVTAGYHRLYSHQTYKAHWAVDAILLFFGAMSAQGSAYLWAHDHRLHHAFADTEKDPYCVKDGLWHAHILWMFKRVAKIDPRIVRDLERNRLVMNQHRFYGLWIFGSNILVTLLMGWLTGAYLTSFLFIWGIRMFLCHHCTWFINSLAHYWGARTFSKEQTAVDNFILSMLTLGEGYHNYHHTFARDYRNGIRWYHFDPTKWLIWSLSKVGLASSLVSVPMNRINEKIVIEQKADLLERLRKSVGERQEALAAMVRNLSDELMQQFRRLKELKDKDPVEQLQLKRRLKESRKMWLMLMRKVHRLPS